LRKYAFHLFVLYNYITKYGTKNIKLAVTIYHAGTGELFPVLWDWQPYFTLGVMVLKAERM